ASCARLSLSLAGLALPVPTAGARYTTVIPLDCDYRRVRLPRDASDEHIQRVNEGPSVGERCAYLGGFCRRRVAEPDELSVPEGMANPCNVPGGCPAKRAEVEFVENDRRDEESHVGVNATEKRLGVSFTAKVVNEKATVQTDHGGAPRNPRRTPRATLRPLRRTPRRPRH